MKKHFRTWGGFWKWNCVLIMPYFCWQLKQLGRNVDFLRSLNNRRGIIKAWSKCGYYCNLGQCYIWSTLHMPRRGLLVFLCNKCPPSLIRMPSAVIIMSHDLLRCLQASVRTNRFCTSVPVQVNRESWHQLRQAERGSERKRKREAHQLLKTLCSLFLSPIHTALSSYHQTVLYLAGGGSLSLVWTRIIISGVRKKPSLSWQLWASSLP